MDEELGPVERELERVAAEAREIEAQVDEDLRPEDRELAAAFVHAQLGGEDSGAAEGGAGGRLLRFAPFLAAAAALVLWLSWGTLFGGGGESPDGVFVGNNVVKLTSPLGPVNSFERFEWVDEDLAPGVRWSIEVQAAPPGTQDWVRVFRQDIDQNEYRPSGDEQERMGKTIRWRVSHSTGHRNSGWHGATLE